MRETVHIDPKPLEQEPGFVVGKLGESLTRIE
jgi:hypothetical protein